MENRLEKYRLVFMGSEIGLEVLGDILGDCHFGESLATEVEMNEHNVGVAILNKCGVFGENTLSQVLNAFTAVSPKQEEEKDEDA